MQTSLCILSSFESFFSFLFIPVKIYSILRNVELRIPPFNPELLEKFWILFKFNSENNNTANIYSSINDEGTSFSEVPTPKLIGPQAPTADQLMTKTIINGACRPITYNREESQLADVMMVMTKKVSLTLTTL